MSIPTFQQLMLPVLIASSSGEVRIGDVVDTLAESLGLSIDERAHLLPSAKQTVFSNRVHWARTYLGKAGLVTSTRRAHFKASPRGLETLRSPPAQIDKHFLSQFSEYREFTGKLAAQDDIVTKTTSDATETKTPDEIMRAAYHQVESSLAEELLSRVRIAPPDFFERLIITYSWRWAMAALSLMQGGLSGRVVIMALTV